MHMDMSWQVRPPAQLQRAPPALPNALHVQSYIAMPAQPWCAYCA
ncbi:hypothetical protein HaLaN_06447, partial [Haematococcus lacustris]